MISYPSYNGKQDISVTTPDTVLTGMKKQLPFERFCHGCYSVFKAVADKSVGIY